MANQRCMMTTSALRMCSRPARYEYIRSREGTSENPDIVVAAYCAQHDRAGGHSRMLRPRAWEYDRKHDLGGGYDVR